jgi:hypothetical protein
LRTATNCTPTGTPRVTFTRSSASNGLISVQPRKPRSTEQLRRLPGPGSRSDYQHHRIARRNLDAPIAVFGSGRILIGMERGNGKLIQPKDGRDFGSAKVLAIVTA